MAKPRADLGSMTVPKLTASQAIPHGPDTSAYLPVMPAGLATRSVEPVKALTVKVKESLYWQMRDYCQAQEKATGQRFSHQDFITEAMEFFLAAKAGK
jgi:hypothetical protein